MGAVLDGRSARSYVRRANFGYTDGAGARIADRG